MPREREVRYVLKRLVKEGWVRDRIRGSHYIFRKDGESVSVPTSEREIAIGTYRSIAKQLGWIEGERA